MVVRVLAEIFFSLSIQCLWKMVKEDYKFSLERIVIKILHIALLLQPKPLHFPVFDVVNY